MPSLNTTSTSPGLSRNVAFRNMTFLERSEDKTSRLQLPHARAAEKHGRVVARVAIGQVPIDGEHAVHDSGKARFELPPDEHAIGAGQDVCRRSFQVCVRRQNAVQLRREQRRGRSLACHVTKRKTKCPTRIIVVVDKVAPNCPAGHRGCNHFESGALTLSLRQQCPLHLGRNVDLPLHTRPVERGTILASGRGCHRSTSRKLQHQPVHIVHTALMHNLAMPKRIEEHDEEAEGLAGWCLSKKSARVSSVNRSPYPQSDLQCSENSSPSNLTSGKSCREKRRKRALNG